MRSPPLTDTNEFIFYVDRLTKNYNSKIVVNNLSFGIKKGEVLGLLGPNGAGKTTAFYMCIGLIKPDGGRIYFNDKDISDLSIYHRAKMGMGYLAQEPSIFRNLTVEKNILCILETLQLSKKERSIELKNLLHELNLQNLAKKKASALSGGEKRRLEITRALVTKPTFILLDEPFANVDPITIHDVKEMIRLLASKNISILITDHNAREIFSVVDRCYLIQNGRVTFTGSSQDLIENESARESYLGKDFVL
ncbi:MAG: Lipopolysaccharide export system ATP-binding protein LptB [Chlamydiae bacterium]|nr:Lipopolysaccharide export system ATP-binding protein LptB [Chlamydiota bacterium]